MALVVHAFYFLILDLQTQESRLQQLFLLHNLKKSRQGVVGVRDRGRVTNFVLKPFKTEILMSNGGKRTSEDLSIIVRLVGSDLAKNDTRLHECIRC